jgi:hypothetical protein
LQQGRQPFRQPVTATFFAVVGVLLRLALNIRGDDRVKDISVPMSGLFNVQLDFARRYAELLADSVGRLGGIQLDMLEKVQGEVCRLRMGGLAMGSDEPPGALNDLPKAMEDNVRKATDASAAYLQSAAQFQSGLIEYVRESLPGLNKQISDNIAQATQFVTSTGAVLHGDTRRGNGIDRRAKHN